MVLSFNTASMVQAPTHLEQQPSVQIFSKINTSYVLRKVSQVGTIDKLRNRGNFTENKCILH